MKRILPAIVLLSFCALAAHAFDFPFGKGKKGKFDLGDLVDAIETGKKIAHAMEATQLTPEQEHYVGRATAAAILAEYKPWKHRDATRYVNLVGQAVAKASDRPETFKGYRFLILDTDEINGLSAPGGFVFITRGLLRCCKTEDQLAAILAHEVAHVVFKHGLRHIRSKRLMPVGQLLLSKALDTGNGKNRKALTKAFNGSIEDVTENLIHGKYSRATEAVADEHAADILQRLGYDPLAFIQVLGTMKKSFTTNRSGFYKTHPDPAWRIRALMNHLGAIEEATPSPARLARFRKAMAGI